MVEKKGGVKEIVRFEIASVAQIDFFTEKLLSKNVTKESPDLKKKPKKTRSS